MKKLSLLLFGVLFSISVKSQEFEILLLANEDANTLFKNYMNPAMKGMQYSLNNGWYQTAKTHKKLGFNITIQANAAIVPKNAQSFLFNENDYKYLTIENGSNTINTVIGGKNTATLAVRIPEADDYKVASFKIPNGVGNDLPMNSVPSPMIQANLGISVNTDISVRYLPNINSNDIDGNLIGFGIKHNVMKYFGPLDNLPLNVSILGGYTKMNVLYDVQNSSKIQGNNQEAEFDLNTYTIQAIASLDFPIISVYGGIGYNKGNSTLKMKGTYELEYSLENSNQTITESITDPLNMGFDTMAMNATFGAKLNLGFFNLFGDYSVNKYNTLSAGIAFSFR